MQDFSIAGIRKQWDKQQYFSLEKPCLRGNERECNLHNTSCENCYDNCKRWVDANRPGFIGAKTETRRTRGLDKVNEAPNRWEFIGKSPEFDVPFPIDRGRKGEPWYLWSNSVESFISQCPYGKIGDELWVKEKWGVGTRPHPLEGWVDGFEYAADMSLIDEVEMLPLYKTDIDVWGYKSGWKSPLFMPKAASRIKLEITGLSIERLHDITEEGAIREGIVFHKDGLMQKENEFWFGKENVAQSAKDMYRNLWINMHGKESWNKSPWVWVIQFTVKEFRNA